MTTKANGSHIDVFNVRANGRLSDTCDWVNDDQPYRMNNDLYSIPYTIELNDRPLFREPWATAWDYERMIKTSFDVLYREGSPVARVMCIALHPFIIGQPDKIDGLRAPWHISPRTTTCGWRREAR